jgi:AraC family transcriptional regulator of adaptative response / DNA-3-methyladenine glycosylase II
MISSGYLDRHDESELAARVGYSTRQLRRLFTTHVGASPAFVARSRRAHFARRLLDESDLPMPTIASASGFGGPRQMNRVIHEIFGFGPRELRAKRRRSDTLVADGGLKLRLPFLEPFDRAGALDHLGSRCTPGVESLEDAIYRRTLVVCGNPGMIEVDLGGAEEHLLLIAHLPTFDSVIDDVSRIRLMFGLDDDVATAGRHLADDPILGELIATRPGVRIIGGWDRFETAVRVVVGQQVSVAGATTTTGRLVAACGSSLDGAMQLATSEHDGDSLQLGFLFPTADQLRGADPAHLGMPRSRAHALIGLASAVADGRVDLSTGDPDQLRSELLALPGIGPWTTELVCMRALRDPDAFPASDLGIRQALGILTNATGPVPAAEAEQMAESWRPFRAVAAQHLWTSLSRRDST